MRASNPVGAVAFEGSGPVAAPPVVLPPPPPPPLPQPVPNYPDGSLLKASSPEIDLMQNHERRWIPDVATFNYLGLNWAAVQTISDANWQAIPAGPPLPSRADSSLLKGSSAAVYVMKGGQRRLIPDPATFDNLGYSWSNVQSVLDADLNAIPQGAPIPEGGGTAPVFPITASRDDQFPGSGGYMHTDATVFVSGVMQAVTHTWEVTDLRGFRGAVAVALLDRNLVSIWVSDTQHFGVDGRWIGTSDRTDSWSEVVPNDALVNARYIAIIQQWDPNVVADIEAWLQGLANVAQTLGPIITVITTIAAA